jgi:hypothetical protein
MPSWDELSARMDAKVDDRLGDTIEVSADAGTSWVARKGFALNMAAGLSLDGIDEIMASRPRIKISKLYVPALTRIYRFRTPKWPGIVFCPGSSEPDDDGRYLIFDVQKA